MKKCLFLAAIWFFSGSAFAVTDHYFLRDGNHVQHLKITQRKNDIRVSVDVDFEANEDETGKRSCSAEISGRGHRVFGPIVRAYDGLDTLYRRALGWALHHGKLSGGCCW